MNVGPASTRIVDTDAPFALNAVLVQTAFAETRPLNRGRYVGSSPSRAHGLNKPVTGLAVATLTAATSDILYAIAYWSAKGVGASAILQSIASGLLGRAAFGGGASAAGIGLLLHYAMMLIIVQIFFQAWRRVPLLHRSAPISGLAYGACVYFFMNWVVVPLSAFPTPGARTVNLQDLAAHMLLVGTPIALAANRWVLAQSPTSPTSTSNKGEFV